MVTETTEKKINIMAVTPCTLAYSPLVFLRGKRNYSNSFPFFYHKGQGTVLRDTNLGRRGTLLRSLEHRLEQSAFTS